MELPFKFRMPTNRIYNHDGQVINKGSDYLEVEVILEPDLKVLAECRPNYGGPVIAMREWNEQVFLHELLHAATMYSQPHLRESHPPEGHDVISRIEVALWEVGWRYKPEEVTDGATLSPEGSG